MVRVIKRGLTFEAYPVYGGPPSVFKFRGGKFQILRLSTWREMWRFTWFLARQQSLWGFRHVEFFDEDGNLLDRW